MYGIAFCPVEYSDELKDLGFAGELGLGRGGEELMDG